MAKLRDGLNNRWVKAFLITVSMFLVIGFIDMLISFFM